jgi:hypothetical protein
MKNTVTAIKLQYNESGYAEIVVTTDVKWLDISILKDILAKGKKLIVEIKQLFNQRSLDANSYCWVIISKIADVIRTNKDDLYIEMLKRYGQREPKLISVVSDAVDIIYRATQNHCCEVGESELNGKVFKHLAILIGSSQYDSKSMAILIDGIVSEAKELDIETMPPAELAGLKEEWGR